MYDVIIVGGGPAGLSAALILGRCRRKVFLCDSDEPRNAVSRGLHGYLTRDGVPPLELRELGRRELRRYAVTYRRGRVESVIQERGRYVAMLEDGGRAAAPFIVLATGVVDLLPEPDGFRRFYGRGVFHCPYCDGWEQRGRKLAAYGNGQSGVTLALALRTWSPDVILLTDGAPKIMPKNLARLRRHGVPLRSEPIARLAGDDRLRRVEFRSGSTVPRDAIFFQGGKVQRSVLCAALGCRFTRKGVVRVRKFERAGPPGLFVIGDSSAGTQLAITAAAEGVRAGVAINEAIIRARYA